jgi:hypothetical protein
MLAINSYNRDERPHELQKHVVGLHGKLARGQHDDRKRTIGTFWDGVDLGKLMDQRNAVCKSLART